MIASHIVVLGQILAKNSPVFILEKGFPASWINHEKLEHVKGIFQIWNKIREFWKKKRKNNGQLLEFNNQSWKTLCDSEY